MSDLCKPRRFLEGANFKNGRLYVFERNSVMVVEPWPKLRAWRMTLGRRKWYQMRPDIELKVSLSGELRRPAYTSRHTEVSCMGFPGERQRWRRPEPENEQAELPFPEEEPDEAQRAAEADEWARIEARWEQRRARDSVAMREFQSHFPVEVRGWLHAFPERQWHLAVLLRGCPGAADLLRANPALAFCVASNWVFRSPRPKQPQRDARRWLQRRQRDIAGWLGFPATEETVKLLRKIPPDACHVGLLLRLRHALRTSDLAATLRHLPRLDTTVLRIGGDERLRPLVAPRLLRELSEGVGQWSVVSGHVRMLHDMLAMAEQLTPPRALPAHHSVRQLVRAHDELADELNRAAPPKAPRPEVNHEFPAPPIPGHDTIVPLTTPAMLAEEGREQRNCVAAYVRRVAGGRHFIYRVLAPERATLLIVRAAQGWRVGELSGVRNCFVSEPTRLAVQRWLGGEGWDERWTPF